MSIPAMRSILPFAVVVFLGLAGFAGAADYTPEFFSGVWRFDVERTRALCGEKAAAEVPRRVPEGKTISLSALSGGKFRLGMTDREISFVAGAELVGELLIIRDEDNSPVYCAFSMPTPCGSWRTAATRFWCVSPLCPPLI